MWETAKEKLPPFYKQLTKKGGNNHGIKEIYIRYLPYYKPDKKE